MDPEKIDPAAFYSARQVAAMGVLPWKSPMTLAKALREEKWADVFRPMLDKKQNAVRIHIKGEAILRFLEMARNGDFSR